MPDTPHAVTCRWVPGTLDRVHVLKDHHEIILDLHDVVRRFGREARDALYLTGRYTTLEAPRPRSASPATVLPG